MKRILLLYFSGAGATKYVMELMQTHLEHQCAIQTCPFEEATEPILDGQDALIVGTPVYHAAPARQVLEYFERIGPRKTPLPAFLYNTRALWSCNTNRILAKKLREKNIVTVLDRDYGSPASDGTLIVPFVKRLFEFEEGIAQKVARDCDSFLAELEIAGNGYIPRFRLSAVLNGPNKLAGQRTTFPIHLHRDACIRCGHCVERCPHRAVEPDGEGYPAISRDKCENCYRCIHHCPARALSLSRRRRPGKQLYPDWAN